MLRSAACGGSGTLVDLAVMIALVELFTTPYGLAAVLGAGAGAGVSFTANRWWAYEDKRTVDRRQIFAFALVALGSMAINGAVVHLLASVMGVPYLIAKCVGTLVVFAAWTYPVQSRFVFDGRDLALAARPVEITVPTT